MLRLFDSGDDPADGGLIADGVGAHHQSSAHHDRTGVHARPDRDADRQILTGDRGLVDDRLAVDHLAVDRDGDMVVDHHLVADLHGVDRHLYLGAGLGPFAQPNPCRVLAAAQQLRDGPPGPPQGQILKVLTDIQQPQHGERDHVLAQDEARHGRGRDQRIGAGLTGAQRTQRPAQERVAGEDGDAGRDQPAAGAEQRRPREHVAAHTE